MLRAVDYPDMGVIDEMRCGAELVGSVEKTGLWPTKFQPAMVTLDELHTIACRERSGLRQQFVGATDGNFIDQVWSKTMDEVHSGILVGPIPLSDILDDCPLSRRFGILQGQKVRCIDHFSRSSVNASVQTCESPKPHTIDVFSAMCVHLMSKLGSEDPWVGRTFDLVGAYKQCAVKPSSKKYAYIVVQKPGSLELFSSAMLALPFGSVRSVHSFLRISHSLWYVLVKEFKVLMTNYFDDFISVAPSSESSSVASCVHMYFKLLGWGFAEAGDKAPPFGASFQALGVNINVSTLHSGLVEIGNTETRRRELVEFLGEVIQRGYMSKQEALRLRGRLQFTSGNVFGRIARCSLAAVSQHAYSTCGAKLSDDVLLALRLHRCLLQEGRPRELKPASAVSWFLQTDACYDVEAGDVVAGIGAVLFDPTGTPVAFFSHKLTSDVVASLNPNGRQTAIFECEFFAVFCAFWLWGRRITDAVVIYTDNNGVRDTLISCVSRNVTARKILIATMALECIMQITPWYARVPTKSLLTRIWLTLLRGLTIRSYLMQGPYVAKLMVQYVGVLSQTSLKNGENIRL